MRIQHNIMAMNAYRNYNTNTSALSRNLEKLSSGYKINRAGDDAAGLAISEKMRAQITGLNAAQKNVKDGISLVKTAEGAMQEIQDMLNRMEYLATQSSNGTYDNEVDRANLQKEVNQLRDEIDRIADSANFNGIKLLDGSKDKDGVQYGTGSTSDLTNFLPATATGTGTKLPAVGSTLGTSTILHTGATDPNAKGTEFSVDLHDVKFDGKEGDVLTIKLGDGTAANGGATITLKALKTADAKLTGKDIVDKILAGTDANYEVTINGTAFNANDKVQIKGADFTLSKGTGNGRLSFQQDKVASSSTNEVLGGMSVTVSGTAGTGITGTIADATVTEDQAPAADKTAKYSYDLTGITDIGKGKYNVSIGGKTVQIELTDDDNDADAVATKIVAAINAAADKGGVKFPDGLTDAGGAATNYTVAANGAKIEFTASKDAAGATAIAGNIAITPAENRAASVSGDWNTETTNVKNVAAAGAERLASTTFTLTKDMVAPGGSMYIGDTYYTFSTDAADKANAGNKVYIGDMVDADGKIDDTKFNVEEVARRLSVSAKDNAVWTVGTTKGSGKITVVERTDAAGKGTGSAAAKTANELDLSTAEGIAKSLGYKGLDVDPTAGAALKLQIGDTSDNYNQLGVNIKDMHVASMKSTKTGKTIAEISVAKPEDASNAIQTIKDAINYVSSVRGDLGATQNRLEHTANNLSVMAENIQDAESTIRDTDVAEEMMAYTKNNILIQSAQAMLAQANAVPQGVLQLLG